jgi:hypothetical protein
VRKIDRHPAVSDVVLYTPSTVIAGQLPDPWPAIVLRVHPPYRDLPLHVAVEVFGHPEKVIHRSVPYSADRKGGCWSWPEVVPCLR